MDIAPPELASRPTAPYVSATRPNWREWSLLLLIAAGMLLALAMPWVFIATANSAGLNFDTWKPLQPGAPLDSFLPGGATELVDTENGIVATYGEGSGKWAMVSKYESAQAAQDAWQRRWASDSWPAGVLSAATKRAPGQWLAYAHLDDGVLIEWVNGKALFEIFAPDDGGLSELITQSPLIDAPAEPGFGHGVMPRGQRLLHVHPAWLAVTIDAVMLALLSGLFWFRLASMQIKAPAVANKAGRETLRNRLLALNNANTPLVVEEQGAYHFVCRWKVDDPTYAPWLSAANLRDAYQLDLYLESGNVVGALETTGRLQWARGIGQPQAQIAWNYLRSVLKTPAPAPAADPAAVVLPAQSSAAADYRTTLQQLVLGSGWNWKPMLFRPVYWEH
jgi:hypothetical protein